MDGLFIDLLPLILGATLVPLYPIIVLMLLLGDGGLAKATAFVAGAVLVRLLQGVIFGLLFAPAVDAERSAGLYLLGPTLLLVVGILLLVAALLKWRKQPDPDEPSPQWMSALGAVSVLKAAGAGILLMVVSVKQWVFTLAAISVIEEAAPGMAQGIGFYLVYVAATQALVAPALVGFALAPQRIAQPLQRAQAWLARHNRVIVVLVSLVFGVWFVYKGASALLAVGAP